MKALTHLISICAIALSAGLTLAESAPTESVYVTGAMVFLDINYNGQFDLNEPSAITGITGDYTTDLSATDTSCLGYAPIVVDVPLGALDADQQPITQSQRITIKPSAQQAFQTNNGISDLTNAVLQAIPASELQTSEVHTCLEAQQQAKKSAKTLTAVEDAIFHAIKHYNVSKADMLQLLTNPKNTEELSRGRDYIIGITKSVEETLALQEKHPDAVWARVSFHQSDYRDADQRFPDDWYRETQLKLGSVQEIHLQKMTQDLSAPAHTIIYGKTGQQRLAGLEVHESIEIESRNGDYSRYTCDIKETVIARAGSREIELVNLAGGEAKPLTGCTTNRAFHGRYVFINDRKNGEEYSAQFYFEGQNSKFSFLPNWHSFEKRTTQYNITELVTFAEQLPYQMDNSNPTDAQWWVKTKTYDSDKGRVRDQYSTFSGWQRELTKPNGTVEESCSFDGKDWRDC
jgi:hypothetical protein